MQLLELASRHPASHSSLVGPPHRENVAAGVREHPGEVTELAAEGDFPL